MSNDTAALSGAMTLYTYFRSSAAFRVRIALNLKGLTPRLAFVHLRQHRQYADEYRRLNPQGVVPTLVHEGRALGQSLAIIEYLDEIVPAPPLLPPDPYGRARVRQIAYAVACDIHPFGNLRVREHLRDIMGHSESELVEWQRHWIALGFGAIEQLVDGDRFCHGDAPTLADVCLIPQLYNARRVGLDLAPYPSLVRIEAAALGLAAFADARPENQPDAE